MLVHCAPILMTATHMFNLPALLYPPFISHCPPPPNFPCLCAICLCGQFADTAQSAPLMTLPLGSLLCSQWLLTNFDCCAMWVADTVPLKEALSLTPVFLQAGAVCAMGGEERRVGNASGSLATDSCRTLRALVICLTAVRAPAPSGQGVGNALDFKDWQLPLGRRFRCVWGGRGCGGGGRALQVCVWGGERGAIGRHFSLQACCQGRGDAVDWGAAIRC